MIDDGWVMQGRTDNGRQERLVIGREGYSLR